MSNSDLLSSRVRNYGRMSERRVVFCDQRDLRDADRAARAMPALIREIVEAQHDTRFDRCHFAEARGRVAGLRDRLLRALGGLQSLHGHPASHQPAPASRADTSRRRVRLSDAETADRGRERFRIDPYGRSVRALGGLMSQVHHLSLVSGHPYHAARSTARPAESSAARKPSVHAAMSCLRSMAIKLAWRSRRSASGIYSAL